jgi:hypothetical protein
MEIVSNTICSDGSRPPLEPHDLFGVRSKKKKKTSKYKINLYN